MDDMTQLGKEALKWAKSQQEKGEKIQFIVEALCEAMIAIAPEDTALRKVILEGPYAELAKILGAIPANILLSNEHG